MTTQLMPPQPQLSPKSERSSDPTVKQIIARARSISVKPPARSGWLLSGLTAVLLWASFTPLNWSPVAWLALVPLCLLIRIPQRTGWMYTAIYVTGLIGQLFMLQWMRLGDVTMYGAWVALSIYTAVYFPVFVGLSRAAVHRLSVPLTLAVPVVWVGLEFVRAHLMTGFSWYYLGHTQYRWLELIQISDLVGAYGVSFIVAVSSACLAVLLPMSFLVRLKLIPPLENRNAPARNSAGLQQQATSLGLCLMLFLSVLGYGFIRRSQANFVEGPRIALIQGNFTTSIKHDPREARRIFATHHTLTGKAVKHQPDLIVWPETMYRVPLLIASPELSEKELRRVAPRIPPEAWRGSGIAEELTGLSQQAGAAMVFGIETGTADAEGFRHYNSAVFVRPGQGIAGRYDKLHRVLFGEYIPLREQFPWLYQVTPFPQDYGIQAGRRASVFRVKQWRLSPVICFEDTVPHLVRRIVQATADENNKTIDCLINLTNDGWFHGSSELDQHLITAAFRAVECRTPMVRAVNTGISAIIDGDGAIIDPDVFIDGDNQGRDSFRDPKTGRWRKQLNAALVDSVPLDDRDSFYVNNGDWFAGTCSICCLVIAVGGVFRRKKETPTEEISTTMASKDV